MARILVVDDNPDVLEQVGRALRDAGYETSEARSGTAALCLLDHTVSPPHDLVLLDIDLKAPELDGIGVLQRMGTGAPPVVVMSGQSFKAADFAGGKVKGVLDKPFDRDELLATVADVLAAKPPGGE